MTVIYYSIWLYYITCIMHWIATQQLYPTCQTKNKRKLIRELLDIKSWGQRVYMQCISIIMKREINKPAVCKQLMSMLKKSLESSEQLLWKNVAGLCYLHAQGLIAYAGVYFMDICRLDHTHLHFWMQLSMCKCIYYVFMWKTIYIHNYQTHKHMLFKRKKLKQDSKQYNHAKATLMHLK